MKTLERKQHFKSVEVGAGGEVSFPFPVQKSRIILIKHHFIDKISRMISVLGQLNTFSKSYSSKSITHFTASLILMKLEALNS